MGDESANEDGQPMQGDKIESPLLRLLHADPEEAAQTTSNTKYADESITAAFLSRVGWLGLFLIGLWGAAFVMDAFEHTLQQNVELAHFIPLIIGQGGNAGSQAVSSVIRALAGKEIDLRSRATAGKVVFKEAAVGALCGANPYPHPHPHPHPSPITLTHTHALTQARPCRSPRQASSMETTTT